MGLCAIHRKVQFARTLASVLQPTGPRIARLEREELVVDELAGALDFPSPPLHDLVSFAILNCSALLPATTNKLDRIRTPQKCAKVFSFPLKDACLGKWKRPVLHASEHPQGITELRRVFAVCAPHQVLFQAAQGGQEQLDILQLLLLPRVLRERKVSRSRKHDRRPSLYCYFFLVANRQLGPPCPFSLFRNSTCAKGQPCCELTWVSRCLLPAASFARKEACAFLLLANPTPPKTALTNNTTEALSPNITALRQRTRQQTQPPNSNKSTAAVRRLEQRSSLCALGSSGCSRFRRT